MNKVYVYLSFFMSASLNISCYSDVPAVPACYDKVNEINDFLNQGNDLCCEVEQDCTTYFQQIFNVSDDSVLASQRTLICDQSRYVCEWQCSSEQCACELNQDCATNQTCQISRDQDQCLDNNLSKFNFTNSSSEGWCKICVDR